MTTPAKGPRPSLPAVHPDDLPAMLRDAKRAGLHRAAPRKLPAWVTYLVLVLGVAGLLAPRPWSTVLSVLGLSLAAVFLIQHFRYAGYVVTTGAQKELDR